MLETFQILSPTAYRSDALHEKTGPEWRQIRSVEMYADGEKKDKDRINHFFNLMLNLHNYSGNYTSYSLFPVVNIFNANHYDYI